MAGEVYLPGGILGLTGLGLFIWSVVAAYNHSNEFGTMLLVCGVVATVSSSWFSFKYLTKTKEGRKVLLMDSEIKLPKDRFTNFVGKIGEAVTDLRPSGYIVLDDQKVEASTDGEYVNKGASVKVIKVEADFLYVKEIKKTGEVI